MKIELQNQRNQETRISNIAKTIPQDRVRTIVLHERNTWKVEEEKGVFQDP